MTAPAATEPVAAPEPQYIERPVEDVDAIPEKEKNRRIAAELFKDDDEPAPQPKAEPKLESPPAQRRREEPAPKRDAMGRAHRSDGTIMPKAEADALAAAPTVAPQGSPAAEAPPKLADTPNVPLRWTAYGKETEIPGALYKPGHGVFIPEASIPDIRRAYARGTQGYETLAAENAKYREGASQMYTAKEAQADAVLSVMAPIFKDAQTFYQFAQRVVANPELEVERLQLAIGRKELEFQRTIQVPDGVGDHASEPNSGEIAEAITDEMEDFFRNPQYGLAGEFTLAEQNALRAKAFEMMPRFLTRVDRDLDEMGNPIVSKDQQIAVRKGEVLVNRAALLAELRFVATHPSRQPRSTGAAPAAANGAPQSGVPASPARSAPPSAVGRSRAQVPSAPQPGTGRRNKDTIPNHSVKAAADWLFGDD